MKKTLTKGRSHANIYGQAIHGHKRTFRLSGRKDGHPVCVGISEEDTLHEARQAVEVRCLRNRPMDGNAQKIAQQEMERDRWAFIGSRIVICAISLTGSA